MDERLFERPIVEHKQKPEKFGDKAKTLEIMENGDELIVCGDIEEFLHVDPHANVVKLAEIPNNEFDANQYENDEEKTHTVTYATEHRNLAELMQLSTENGSVLGIYKPYDGEKDAIKDEFGRERSLKGDVKRFYLRERIAYLVSEHFNFNMVPPTVVRDQGSVQLFMDPEKYLPLHKTDKDYEIDYEALHGLDFQTMAVLDFIILNVDRRSPNYLANLEDNSELIAIDNSLTFGSVTYRDATQIYGPSCTLTSKPNPEFEKDKRYNPRLLPAINQIPEEILSKLQQAYDNRHTLTQQLQQIEHTRWIDLPKGETREVRNRELTDDEINKMWKRVELLLAHKVFLSRENLKEVTGIDLKKPESWEVI